MSNSHTGNSYIKDGLQKVKIWDGTNQVTLDSVSQHLTIIHHEHEELHQGNAFQASYSVADLGAMTSPDDTIQLHFTTPATKKLHMLFIADAGGSARFTITEAPSAYATPPTGTVTVFNRDRNSSTSSAVSAVHYDAARANAGTVLEDVYIGQTFNPNSSNAGSRRGVNELVLKTNTRYAVTLYGTASIPATLILNWYEVSV